ncbi:hypothetical protein SERLADRAFT_442575 [Serpula lacrymans var. lacrymans S7.9]|uniref:Uncharacterized protein n=1 Tax=Serpula lacrymans var. lacrymans (strain S7.9) TaxID=578457 RepID=F8PAA5_SERL9|nr:uncharacterized protein SERLADRAFT_442575 [Serpula lacrymans var. lacrymans S7.9]EGO19745.1 hypothetical protein SERLADRAFT_442575 [Serpula lacrymans var. lacrymans S7.9]
MSVANIWWHDQEGKKSSKVPNRNGFRPCTFLFWPVSLVFMDLDEPLDLQLFRDDDDDGDLFYKRRLHALINGNVSPPKAATNFDTYC